jgi:hypothetical protein
MWFSALACLTWKAYRKHPDFADGRFIPFAGAVFSEQKLLLSTPLGSAVWQEAANRWNINTIGYSLSRYAGLGSFPLDEYCHSAKWKPVIWRKIERALIALRTICRTPSSSRSLRYDSRRKMQPLG